MSFFAAQVNPQDFQTFDLASAFNNGQKVGNALRDTQDDNALQQYHQMHPDATPEQTLAWAYQNMAPRNADYQLERHKQTSDLEEKKAQKVRQRTADLMGISKVLAPALRGMKPEEWQSHVNQFADQIRNHGDHEMADLLTGSGPLHYASIFNLADQAEQKDKMDYLIGLKRAENDLPLSADKQLEFAKASQPKLDESTGALVYPSLNGQQPRIEYPLNTPKAIQDRQAYDSALTSMDNLYKNITDLENHKGLNGILGPIDARTPDVTNDAANAEALRQEIISKSALGTMQALKSASSSGATGFGALNGEELKILQNAEANLARTQDVNQFKKQLGELKAMIESRKQQAYRGMTARYGNSVVAPITAPQQQYPEGTIRSKGALKQVMRNGNWEDVR